MAHEYTVVMEQDEEGFWVVHVPALKGCWSQGLTEEEALANIEDAIDGWLAVARELAERDLQPGQSLRQVPVT